jgi:pimeloyl-ACP methyl ester carboxylesterase
VAEVGRLLKHLPPAAAREAFATSAMAKRLGEESRDNLAALLDFFDRTPHDLTAALLTAIASDGPRVSADEVRAIAIPTLVIGHEGDAIHPLAYAYAIAGLIPGAHLRRITPKSEDHDRYVADFRAVLASFLEELL